MVSRQQRHFTTYVRVQKWKALQVEVHPMSGDTSKTWRWFEDRHLQEVLQLLRGPIFERVKLKRQEITKNMTKSEIATGPSVRIGYVFRPKPEYQTCLLPTSQPLYTSDSEDEEETCTSDRRYQYRNLGLHHEKLVVYTCLVKEASAHSTMAQLLSAIGENSPQPKTVSISSYFNRVVPPGSSQSSQASSSTTETDKTRAEPHKVTSTKITGRATDPRKRKLKCIVKRSGPKLSKKVKKMKLSPGSVATVPCSTSSRKSNSEPNTKHDGAEDEFSRLSFYGDLPVEESHSKQERDKKEVCDGKMILVSMDTFKHCKMKNDSKEVKETDCELLSRNSDLFEHQAEERNNDNGMSDEVNLIEEETGKKGQNCGNKSTKQGPVSIAKDEGNISSSSELSLFLVVTPTSTPKDGDFENESSENDVHLEKINVQSDFVENESSENNIHLEKKNVQSHFVENESLENDLPLEKKDLQSDVDVESISSSQSVDNEPRVWTSVERTSGVVTNQTMDYQDTSVKELVPVSHLLSSPAVTTSKHESMLSKSKNNKSETRDTNHNSYDITADSSAKETPSNDELPKITLKKRDQADNPISSVATANSSAKESQSNDELPTITLKKRDRSWRKSLAMMMTETPEPNKPVEVINCEEIDCDLMEDLAKLPKHKMCLSSRFRKELEGISHESQLTESHIEQMVLGSKDYLFSIFMGKHMSRRHADYKKGGIARFNLNYQVNLGMFTETQQDAVMDTLMTIFCKRHHKYMDYILKVLLPEMMIWILMEVKHTSYEETESLMSGYIM